jgi:hypothetical protein
MNATMSDAVIANATVTNPQPILQQQASSRLSTNPFIPDEQKRKELDEIQKNANDIIEEQYNSYKTSSIRGLTLKQISTNISMSIIGFMDDVFKKPTGTPWTQYLPHIIQKDGRYTYFGIMLVVISIIIHLTRKR